MGYIFVTLAYHEEGFSPFLFRELVVVELKSAYELQVLNSISIVVLLHADTS